jgi:hypothetical protein
MVKRLKALAFLGLVGLGLGGCIWEEDGRGGYGPGGGGWHEHHRDWR